MSSSTQYLRVLSGMRPTGTLHLGHYHGVMKNWLKLQERYQCFFFVADWHALTTHYSEFHVIQESIREIVIDWLAVGIDPKKSILFLQSGVPEHGELYVLLSMITPLSWLERVPTFKTQQQELKEKDLATYGFLGYPLLQSADILAHKANFVPVGEDQLPHLEITREIARRFNYLFGKGTIILPEPKPILEPSGNLPGIDGRKMSKSYHNTIGLREDPASITKKIRTMPTDPARIRRQDPGNPEKCPVWPLHRIFSNEETQKWVQWGCTTAGIGCLECKQPVIDAILKETNPIRERAKPWTENPALVTQVIQEGNEKAREEAGKVVKEVKQAMGLTFPS